VIDLRLRSSISDEELEEKVGKIVTDRDYNVRLTGPAKVRKPDGTLLCVYLPGALRQMITAHDGVYAVLHSLRTMVTDNRGDASGSKRYRYGEEKRTRSKKVPSTIIGSFDAGGPKQFCRLTAWTGQQTDRFALLRPLFQVIGDNFKAHVPDRYAKQMAYVAKTAPEWVIPGTPFSTITVNNTYPTGVHTDKGDLADGFSTLAVIRRGDYSGGVFVFPKYRVAVDMQDGDLLLLDAHEHHGNTAIEKHSEDAERISVVCYYRTGMVECGTADEEYRKAVAYAERRGGVTSVATEGDHGQGRTAEAADDDGLAARDTAD
jgi:hypothetical protein